MPLNNRVCRTFFLLYSLLLCSACSFTYRDPAHADNVQPDMLFSNITLRRYTNALRDLVVEAKNLEMYDAEKVWAADTVSFIQYEQGTQTESLHGNARLLYIDEKAEEYLLGSGVFFRLQDDDFSVQSSAIIWKKKEQLLSAPSEEYVTVSQGKNTFVKGKGFAAHTGAKTFSFDAGVSGMIEVTDALSTEDRFSSK